MSVTLSWHCLRPDFHEIWRVGGPLDQRGWKISKLWLPWQRLSWQPKNLPKALKHPKGYGMLSGEALEVEEFVVYYNKAMSLGNPTITAYSDIVLVLSYLKRWIWSDFLRFCRFFTDCDLSAPRSCFIPGKYTHKKSFTPPFFSLSHGKSWRLFIKYSGKLCVDIEQGENVPKAYGLLWIHTIRNIYLLNNWLDGRSFSGKKGTEI